MSQFNLLDEIRRVKNTSKPVSKRAKHKEQVLRIQRFIQEASQLREKTKSCSSVVESVIRANSCSSSQAKNYSFKGKSFHFPLRDLELSLKRVEILQRNIQKRQGTVYNMKQQGKNQVTFVVSSPTIPMATLLQHLQQDNRGIKYQKIISFNYLIDCEKEGLELSTEKYELYKDSFTCRVIQKGEKSNKQLDIMSEHPRKYRLIQEQKTDFEDDFGQFDLSSTLSIPKMKKQKSSFTVKKNESRNHESEKKQIDKMKFSCQKGSLQSDFYINQYIYEELMKFYNIYQNQKDTGRKIAYLKAASAIKSFHKEIESQKDLSQLRGIGKQITKKVKELLETGQIQKLEKLKQSQQVLVCQQLTRVWGIGSSKAKQLYFKGITSLDVLREHMELLNKNQKIGLKYIYQFQERIPREKVKKILQFVKAKVYELVKSKQLHHVEVCGSYRRGKETCGDIDIIIARKDGLYQPNLIIDLLNKLQKDGFLTDHLNIPSVKPNEAEKSISYMGVCVFQEPKHHRIDIKYYPIKYYAFATLYFTGSDMFNRSMRLFARKKGFSLSDHGIVPVQRNGASKVWKGQQVILYSEEQIFEFLGLDFKRPEERNI